MRNITKILDRSQRLFLAGNMKKSYSIAIDGITELSQVNRRLNEETQGWDLKKAFDYKGKYKVYGKSLNNWMEKFWNIIEDNDLDLVYSEPISIEGLKSILLYNPETKEEVYYTH